MEATDLLGSCHNSPAHRGRSGTGLSASSSTSRVRTASTSLDKKGFQLRSDTANSNYDAPPSDACSLIEMITAKSITSSSDGHCAEVADEASEGDTSSLPATSIV